MIWKRVVQTLAFAFLCLGWLGGPAPSLCRAELIPDVGTAGHYGVLGLENTPINNVDVTVNGNEGVSQGGSLVNTAPSIITGDAFESAAGQYSGSGLLVGSLFTGPNRLTRNDTDALSASAAAAALAPTQTLNGVNLNLAITGDGGLTVIDVNGDITHSLTLRGTSNDIFVVNVTGDLALGANSVLGVAGGVTPEHVLYNFIGNDNVTTSAGDRLNGTLLGPNTNFTLDGTVVNGEVFGGGQFITLQSGTVINARPFIPTSKVPEIDPGSAAGALALLCGGTLVFADRRRRLPSTI